MTAANAGSPAADSEAPVRVLVVDDDDVMRRAWRRILRPPEFEVDVAARADEALAALGRAPFDVVVLDIVMPGQSGMEVLPIIKRLWPEIEVVMMTAFGGVDAAVQAVKLGAYEFLTKPFDSIDGAARAVRNAAGHKRLADRARRLEAELRRRDETAHAGGGDAGRAGARRTLGESPAVREQPLGETSYSVAKARALRAFDRVYVQTLLERTGGNVSEAARLAGLDRSNFRRIIKRAGGALPLPRAHPRD